MPDRFLIPLPGIGTLSLTRTEYEAALITQAAENGSTVRALILVALSNVGYPMAADELVDRRRMRDVLEQ